MNKTTKAFALLFTAGLVLAGCGQNKTQLLLHKLKQKQKQQQLRLQRLHQQRLLQQLLLKQN